MIRSTACLAVLAAILSGPSAANAADAPGSYTMTPTDDGALRLDTRTGAVSACSRTEDGWECRAVVDDRQELQKQLDRLARQNERLKQRSEPAPREKAEGGRSWLPD